MIVQSGNIDSESESERWDLGCSGGKSRSVKSLLPTSVLSHHNATAERGFSGLSEQDAEVEN